MSRRLGKVVRYSVRFDNVIDKRRIISKRMKNQKNERRVGLSGMGLAELMIRLKIRYGSEESLEFLDKLYGFIAREAYCLFGNRRGKGSFPMFDCEKFLQSGFMKQ